MRLLVGRMVLALRRRKSGRSTLPRPFHLIHEGFLSLIHSGDQVLAGARVANRPLPSIKYRESSSKLTLQKLDANKFFGWFPAAGKSSQRCFEYLTNQASLILGQLRCAHGQVKHVDGLLSFGINQSHFDIAR